MYLLIARPSFRSPFHELKTYNLELKTYHYPVEVNAANLELLSLSAGTLGTHSYQQSHGIRF
jgi:hypothetical protein